MAPDPLAELARLEGVPSALSAARDAVDSGLRRRGLRELSPAELTAARRAGAEASAELTGDADSWRPGCWAVAAELEPLSRLITTAPLQAVARTHLLAASGTVGEAALGRVRPDPEVAERMQGLAAVLTRPTRAPALVLAAVAHAEIATVLPFGTGDDVVARSVERAVLMATGLDPSGSVPMELGHLRLAADYRQGLRGYADGGVAGVRDWLLHCARALQAATGS